jgi:hypothetical protein
MWEDNEGVSDWSISKIPVVTELDVAFPAKALEWLPDWKSIAPTLSEALQWQDSEWGRVVSDVFFQGGVLVGKVLDDVDKNEALKAFSIVRASLGSFACSHEQKICACAWILSQYFELPKT